MSAYVPTGTHDQQKTRRDLVHQYMRLQRELIDGDPGSSSYQATIHAFRQMGYALIAAGLDGDLDRLLRLRVLEGGRQVPSNQGARTVPEHLHVIERVPS